jgi:hypothetical protein
MKLIIPLLLFSLNCFSQATLDGGSSLNTIAYRWKQLTGVVAKLQTPDSVVCRVTSLTVGTRQFELTCTNQNGVDKDTVQITVVSPTYTASITNPKISTFLWIDKLSWNASNVKNATYFLIEKSSGKTFAPVTQIISRGNTSYQFTVNRSWFSSVPKYKITPMFSNGKFGTTVKFN